MNIICIARNYDPADPTGAVARTLPEAGRGAAPAGRAERLAFYLKPATALLRPGEPFYLPDFAAEFRGGVGIAVQIERTVRSIEERFAHRCYAGLTLAVAFTAADEQRQACAEGAPWGAAEAFDRSFALACERLPFAGDRAVTFALERNGHPVIEATSARMNTGIDALIAALSRRMTLRTGDVLFTGSPATVGPLRRGDMLRATLDGQQLLYFEIR